MKDKDWPILGYVDRFSVEPGGSLAVMVSTEHPVFDASVVRLGGSRPEPVTCRGEGSYPGQAQVTFPGSYVVVPRSLVLGDTPAMTVLAWIFPTMPAAGRLQGLVTNLGPDSDSGWGLFLSGDGRLLFRVGLVDQSVAELTTRSPVRARNWYFVAASHDSSNGKLRITQQALKPWLEPMSSWEIAIPAGPCRVAAGDYPLLIGAGRWSPDPRPHADETYDGKIGTPSVIAGVPPSGALDHIRDGKDVRDVFPGLILASWDFSIGISSSVVTDTSGNGLHGTCVNTPARAVTGHAWRAAEQCYLHAPHEYAAIHFHSDDISDACWDRSFELQLSPDLPSGAYAVHLEAGGDDDDIPFFVLPDPSRRARMAFLASTYTYLAYGNKHSSLVVAPGSDKDPRPSDLFLASHPELGVGLYDTHADGSGCCYTSRMRPLVTMRPDYRTMHNDERNYSADLLFVQWLERRGYRYDVITDEELHTNGLAALSSYAVVITGSHPEYYSSAMLDGVASYVEYGGKLMYLGGNGFYWVTSVDPERPHIIEVRRGAAGTRTWSSDPGESYHSTTGEFGGLWRHRGRSPNQVAGVGFGAMGSVGAAGYIRAAGSFSDDVSFIFDGIREDEVIGDFGAIDGGAAGDEVDRMDIDLGSPPSTVLLASATGLNNTYLIAIEDIGQTTLEQDATRNPRARADMVYARRGNGGAMFSVGSINWFGSIGFNGDDNNVSRITQNVLDSFLGLQDGT